MKAHRGHTSRVRLRPRPPTWLARIARAKKRKGYDWRKKGFSETDRRLSREWETCAAGKLGLPVGSMFQRDEWWAPAVTFCDAVLRDDWELAETQYKKLAKIARKKGLIGDKL